jgi:membrane protease YdiL (CAAX protease family)
VSIEATEEARSADTDRTVRRSVARWRAPGALATVVGAVALNLGVSAALWLLAGAGPAPSHLWDFLALVLGDLVMLGVVLLVARRGAERLGPATLGIRRTRLGPAIGWTLTIYFGVAAVEGLWTALVGGPSGRANHHPVSASAAVLALVAVSIVAPIVEEIAFRGYLFPALTRWRGPWIGAVTCALLFGAAHLAVYPVQILPALAVFGFGQCLLFWFTGSLLPCIALHAFNNALVAALLLGLGGFTAVAALGAPALALALVTPLARERAPQAA